MIAPPEEVEHDEGDILDSAPPPAMSADPFDHRDSAPDVEEEVPASQRQRRVEDRPLDDALEGISEPPPESGEVESQRYTKVSEEIDPIEQTTEVRALASVDVADRPRSISRALRRELQRHAREQQAPELREILDSALICD